MAMNPIILRIESAIGQTCFWWSRIEHLVHDLCLHLASCLSIDFDRSVTRVPLHMALTNMDLRQRIATAKALASQAPTANATFYDRLERVLNLWAMGEDEKTIERFQQRTIVTRPQSRQRELLIGTTQAYASIEDVEAFVVLLEQAFRGLCEFDGETASMASELARLEALPKPTPAAS
jgi:hypothetical protein